MVISRIKQGLLYLFGRYNNQWEDEIRETLSEEEFKIYLGMGRYDKIHSYHIYKRVKESPILKTRVEYHKLALLHDCGKESFGLIKRVKKVLVGDSELELHNERGMKRLHKINREVGELVYNHHNRDYDEYMREFQIIDDE